ncbi:MAG: hypothetical protein ACFFGZ_00810 [Candidatus Thorarchaeota archaeon]
MKFPWTSFLCIVLIVSLFVIPIFTPKSSRKADNLVSSNAQLRPTFLHALESNNPPSSPVPSFDVSIARKIAMPLEDIPINISLTNSLIEAQNFAVFANAGIGLQFVVNGAVRESLMMTKSLNAGQTETIGLHIRTSLPENLVIGIFRFNVSVFGLWDNRAQQGERLGTEKWIDIMVFRSYASLERYLNRMEGSSTTDLNVDRFSFETDELGVEYELTVNISNPYSEKYYFHWDNSWNHNSLYGDRGNIDQQDFSLEPNESEVFHRLFFPPYDYFTDYCVGAIHKLEMWLDICPERDYPSGYTRLGHTSVGLSNKVGFDQPIKFLECYYSYDSTSDSYHYVIKYEELRSFNPNEVEATVVGPSEDAIETGLEIAREEIRFAYPAAQKNVGLFLLLVGASIAISLWLEGIPQAIASDNLNNEGEIALLVIFTCLMVLAIIRIGKKTEEEPK